jgi:hypothetical protein
MSRQILPADDPDLADAFENVASVSVRQACALIPAGPTRVYELINNGEVESYLDGSARRITLRSIRARRDRLLAQNDRNRPGANNKQPPHGGRSKRAADQPAT